MVENSSSLISGTCSLHVLETSFSPKGPPAIGGGKVIWYLLLSQERISSQRKVSIVQ